MATIENKGRARTRLLNGNRVFYAFSSEAASFSTVGTYGGSEGCLKVEGGDQDTLFQQLQGAADPVSVTVTKP